MIPLQGLTSPLDTRKFYDTFVSLIPLSECSHWLKLYARDKTMKEVKFVFESLPLIPSAFTI